MYNTYIYIYIYIKLNNVYKKIGYILHMFKLTKNSVENKY